ncbi:YfcE family phosphodiesterase [Harryflintia acetispora]|nr:YfcE family phosphodiesterase [Harryflintia acetispora]
MYDAKAKDEISMRIVAVGDTHRDFMGLRELIEQQMDSTDLFIHTGDGERELDDIRSLYPELPLRAVCGNCDLYSSDPQVDLIDAGGVKIFVTHGHGFGVKYSVEELEQNARRLGAAIVLFGHTHCQYYRYDEGLHLLNPGSLSHPRGTSRGYAVIEIQNGQILCNLVQLR